MRNPVANLSSVWQKNQKSLKFWKNMIFYQNLTWNVFESFNLFYRKFYQIYIPEKYNTFHWKIYEKFGKCWNFSGASPQAHQGLCPCNPAERGCKPPCNPLRERLPSRYPLIPPNQNPGAANGYPVISSVSLKLITSGRNQNFLFCFV